GNLVAGLDVLADLDPVGAVFQDGAGRQLGPGDRDVVLGAQDDRLLRERVCGHGKPPAATIPDHWRRTPEKTWLSRPEGSRRTRAARWPAPPPRFSAFAGRDWTRSTRARPDRRPRPACGARVHPRSGTRSRG